MPGWFSGGPAGQRSHQRHLSSKIFQTSRREEETGGQEAMVPNPTHPGKPPNTPPPPAQPLPPRQSPPPYLVPLLQLVVGELGVLPQVLQHLRPQLAVLLPHVGVTRLTVALATAVTITRLPGRLSHLPVRGRKKGRKSAPATAMGDGRLWGGSALGWRLRFWFRTSKDIEDKKRTPKTEKNDIKDREKRKSKTSEVCKTAAPH